MATTLHNNYFYGVLQAGHPSLLALTQKLTEEGKAREASFC